MKRSLTLLLTSLALVSGSVDAARRSGGGFGGSRSGGYSAPRYRAPAPRYTPPRTNTTPYTAPRTTPTRTPSSTQRTTTQTGSTLPSTASVKTSPLNRAAAARVTPTQLNQWNKVKLPAGVPRDAITYSAAPSSRYQYQLQPGRYYPYPQSYYRQNNIGFDILKYALIFTAVSSIADAVTPDVVVTSPANAPVAVQQRGPSFWNYVSVGLLAAAAAWFLMGRRR